MATYWLYSHILKWRKNLNSVGLFKPVLVFYQSESEWQHVADPKLQLNAHPIEDLNNMRLFNDRKRCNQVRVCGQACDRPNVHLEHMLYQT